MTRTEYTKLLATVRLNYKPLLGCKITYKSAVDTLFPTIIDIVIAIGSINIKYFFAQPRHGKLQHVCNYACPKRKL